MHFKMVIMSKLTFVLMVHTAILADEMGLGKTVQVFHATSGLLMQYNFKSYLPLIRLRVVFV